MSSSAVLKSEYAKIHPYTTKDGSTIRELMHPNAQEVRHQSLAEAQVEPGETTCLHRHRVTEELYHITRGSGIMTVGNDEISVAAGDTVCIPPMTPHRIRNSGDSTLDILCCCAPAYSHEDTELLE